MNHMWVQGHVQAMLHPMINHMVKWINSCSSHAPIFQNHVSHSETPYGRPFKWWNFPVHS